MASTRTDEPVTAPWVTCFLTGMVIRYLDGLDGAAGRMDYHRVMGVAEGFDHIRDPKAFLLDPNNWIPHAVLRELIRRSEEASGSKEVTYRASLAFFASAEGRQPTLIETVAKYLGDVDAVVRCSGLWATAYSNYLRMQAFARPEESRTLYILVRFLPPVEPLIGNSLLVKGNIEGFSQLYPFVSSVSCEEQYSQVRLAAIVEEFGEGYALKANGAKGAPTGWTIKERATGRTVATARSCGLGPEPVAGWEGGQALAPDLPAQRSGEGGPAIRIERGGVLRAGSLEYALREGAIYDAPYTRYRFRWQERPKADSVRQDPDSGTERTPKEVISRLLFDHLAGLQATQRRVLGIFIHNRELSEENKYLREELYGATETGGMVGRSRPMQELLNLVRSVAQSDVSVLITGETGTGKEQTARLVHQLSPRRAGRFLAINCGALAESLLESELFGHERGAFSGAVAQKKGKFEQAAGGTLFLDEIGEVSPAMQVKLLRVLQEREVQRVGGHEDVKVDVRIVAATNQDLRALVAERKFREDLFYRLNVFPLQTPPLRERTEDIPLIAQHLLARHASAQKKTLQGFTSDALDVLMRYRWPGNVRELENVIERAVALAGPSAPEIGPNLLPQSLREARETITAAGLEDLVDRVEWPLIVQALKGGKGLTDLLKRIEWALIQRAVKEHSGNKTAAARILGRTYRWLRKAETDRPPSRD
ncbi:MAG: sigma-54-dependent Fis family transcriptional regulator [Nitrospiraceae bacterium]|nr:MAG: sigma-54-dependent Fis family transcriptional regulator [Nitrospiraceae bacterium]